MTTTTATPTLDLSTDKKLKALLIERVKVYYDDEYGVGEVYVKMSKMSWDNSIDPLFMGNMWTILVSYRDDDEECIVYQTKTIPDPRYFKRGNIEEQVAFIDRCIEDLRTSFMYLNDQLYSLQYK